MAEMEIHKMKAKKAIPEFKLLNAEMVAAVQSTTDGVIQQSESASEIGAMLHDAGYTSDMLDKKGARPNEALIAEITTAIMYAPRFSARDRELIINAEAGKTMKTNADRAAIHLGRAYIRQTFAAIRKGIQNAKLREERGPKLPEGLKAKLGKILESGVNAIKRDDGKHGAPMEQLRDSFLRCKAEVNGLFSGASKAVTK